MEILLEIQNKKARPVNYAYNKPSANSTWMSRNMVISGLVILAFIVLHSFDFWFPELNYKYFSPVDPADPARFLTVFMHNYTNTWILFIVIFTFVYFMLH